MKFQEILKQCVLVAVIFGLAGSVQAQGLELSIKRDTFIGSSLINYKEYLNRGSSENGIDIPFITAPGLMSGPDDSHVAPGQLVREVVTDEVNTIIARFGFLPRHLGEAFTGPHVQELLNNRAVREALVSVAVMNAYSFSGVAVDAASKQEHFVINLARDHVAALSRDAAGILNMPGALVVPTRLIKRLMNGEWKGFDHGPGGTVSYSQMVHPDRNGRCPEPNHEPSWIDTINGLIPAALRIPVHCIRVTVVHQGIYDVDGRHGHLSDPIMGVDATANPQIQHAHASASTGGGSGGGSAGAWTVLALLTILALSTWRRRRVAVRSEL